MSTAPLNTETMSLLDRHAVSIGQYLTTLLQRIVALWGRALLDIWAEHLASFKAEIERIVLMQGPKAPVQRAASLSHPLTAPAAC